jgi:hypothetical protein
MGSVALGLRNLIVALSALAFGAGQAACACLPNLPAPGFSAAGHALDGVGHGHSGHAAHDGRAAPSSPTDGSCVHCQSAKFAAPSDAAELVAAEAAPAPVAAVLPVAAPWPSPFLKAAARLHWAAPPGLTPVALKIRLLN